MKKVFLFIAVASFAVACNNSADTAANTKDSLDSIEKLQKESVENAAKDAKENIDSTIENKKDSVDAVTDHAKDTANH